MDDAGVATGGLLDLKMDLGDLFGHNPGLVPVLQQGLGLAFDPGVDPKPHGLAHVVILGLDVAVICSLGILWGRHNFTHFWYEGTN